MTPSPRRSIPFFDYPYLFLSEEKELVAIFRDVGRRGAFIQQEDVSQFEQNLGAFTGSKHAIGVANATDALLIALQASGIGPGDEVIFCSHTMVATAAAAHFAGAIPVPVECGPDHLIDPAKVQDAITPRTRAILPTQLNGRTADMERLLAIAEKHGLLIIEDAAQGLGSRFRGQCAGTFGAASAISFFPAKLLGCLGDGGAVLTNDANIARRVVQLHDHGRDAAGQVVSWGLNSRLDNLHAAILDYRLRNYAQVINRRRALARIYRERLSGVEELVLPPGPDNDPDHFDVFQNYEVEALQRDELRGSLRAKGIGTVIPWGGKAVHQWEGLRLAASLPYIESLFARLLLLPLNLSLTDDDVHQVCDAIQSFYRA
jgi:dTDP-4-amino-4,6-dideoxygalactose transaminase